VVDWFFPPADGMQNQAYSTESYERFVSRVLKSGMVWGLRASDGGWAVSPSQAKEGQKVMVFWSDRAYADRHAKDEWQDYSPVAIPLNDFIDSWLYGMHQDGVMVGPNWDAQLCGAECSARELAQDLNG
jgi:hypothetical protein